MTASCRPPGVLSMFTFQTGFVSVLALTLFGQGAAQEKKSDKLAAPITKGQRVFTCGHSFHVWVPDILVDLAKKADIKDHVKVGLSSIGGSKVIQHWNKPDDQNNA